MKTLIVQDIFKIPKLIFGILFILAGIVSIYFHQYGNLVVVPIGVLMLTHSSGLELDFESGKYRVFTKFFRHKKGEWRSLAYYSAVIVLRKEGKTSFATIRSTLSSTIRYHEYQVFLTDQSHRKRLYLKHFDTADQARKFALDFMEKTGIPLERFNPVISEQTRNRR